MALSAQSLQELMRTLMDSTSGSYIVRTLTSNYNIDLDAMRFTRHPIETDATPFPNAEEVIALVSIDACTVGERMHLKVDMGIGSQPWTRLASTHVLSIELSS